MVSRIIEGMVGFFTGPKPANEQQVTETETRSTDLYTCSDCTETYITDEIDEMDVCPNCGEAVESTPSFAELGIGRNDGR